ncbi:MAG: extracellular solute-binding protein [Clostridia bacterium]
MKNSIFKRLVSSVLLSAMCMSVFVGCSAKEQEVVFYSNADDEAVVSMKATLDANGYEGKYIFQSFGTSELGGKLLAEGTNIEADVITMSSYYVESSQVEHNMFLDLTFDTNTLDEYPSYYTPFIGNQGALIINTEEISALGLDIPESIADLADEQYAGVISVVDITGSSTAWLMVQALVDAYGEDETQDILSGIYENAGAHLETSGSAPIKKVRAGEVAIGFGLRHQAVADKEDGLPVDFVDPTEGNFTLTESLAVVNKGDKTNSLAMEMVQCIIEEGRESLMENYPVPLYNGETADETALSPNSKVFSEPLTVDLLKEHEAISEAAK